MNSRNKAETTTDLLIAVALMIASVEFSGLSEPWIPVACGGAAAISLWRFPNRVRHFIFAAIASLSVLENSPWFLSSSTLAFGIAGTAISWVIQMRPSLGELLILKRFVQALPVATVVLMFPVTASLWSPKAPRRAILDGGVWATVGVLEEGAAALSTEHQYTYERFRDMLEARVIGPDAELSEIDELILITPTTPMDLAFIRKVKDWTGRGGRLLVVADHTNLFGHQTVLKEVTEEFGIALRPDALFETQTNGGIYSNFLNKFAGLTPCSISRGVVPRLKMMGWSESPNYTATSFFGDLDPTNDDHFGYHTVLGSRRIGWGEVSVFSDSTFFANFAISRWSSQMLLGSLFWARTASVVALIGVVALICYITTKGIWLGPFAIGCVLLSPAVGFSKKSGFIPKSAVVIAPPRGVENDSEERDKGVGSSLLASAYAFGVTVNWDPKAPLTFKEYVREHGLTLTAPKNGVPGFDIGNLAKGEFYVDQNSFWFGQGVGLLRAANMANLWRSMGAEIGEIDLTVVEEEEKEMTGNDGKIFACRVQFLKEGWAVIDNRIVVRWVPETSKWLARKEWQFAPFGRDLFFKPR